MRIGVAVTPALAAILGGTIGSGLVDDSLAQRSAAIALAAGGALYDPSDLTSLYQFRAGGSTGASGSVVGIMLDKSYMGGQTAAAFIAGQTELAPNGNFSSDTGWVKGTGWSITGGEAVGASVPSGSGGRLLVDGLSAVSGRWYSVTFTVTVTSGGIGVYCGGSSGVARSSSGTYVELIQSNGTAGIGFERRNADFTGTVDNVSVKEVPGFHALAPSDAARPLLTVASGLADLTADGVDDWMNVTPTLNLGEAWWHVGGWQVTNSLGRPFTVGTGNSAPRADQTNDEWEWRDSGGSWVTVASGDPALTHVLTLERAATISGRYNSSGAASRTPFVATNSKLALFSDTNASFSAGAAGRFYGGAFAPGAISSTDRATLEQYVAQLSGVTL